MRGSPSPSSSLAGRALRMLRRQARAAFVLAIVPQLVVRPCDALYDSVNRVLSARLYGNIDAFAYYFVDVLVGTPPQRVSLIVDTGSSVTAYPCKKCRSCGQHVDANFDFDRSQTASWLGCTSECHTTCREGHCSYHQGYTEGSSISGWYHKDQVHLGDLQQRNPRVMATMGCHNDENKLFYTQKANGIMGIAPRRSGHFKTILEELWSDKEHTDSSVFSMCLSAWGGRLVVGGYNSSYHTGKPQFVPFTDTSGAYHVPLSAMVVDDEVLHTRYGKATLDSGTTYTFMARGPYRALKAAIEKHCAKNGGDKACGQPRSKNCFHIPTGDLSAYPTVEVWFGNVKTLWRPEAYMYRKGGNNSARFCYGFEDDGPYANTVLGASWMMHQDIIFDISRNRVGIAPAKCPQYESRPEHDESRSLSLPPPSVQDASRASVGVVAGSRMPKPGADGQPPFKPWSAPPNTRAFTPTGGSSLNLGSFEGGFEGQDWWQTALLSFAALALVSPAVLLCCRQLKSSSHEATPGCKNPDANVLGQSSSSGETGGSSPLPWKPGSRSPMQKGSKGEEEKDLLASETSDEL